MCFLHVFVLVFLPAAYPAHQDHQVVKAKLGQNVTLGCPGPSDGEVTLFTWTKVGLDSDYVFLYRNGRSYPSYQHQFFRGRVDMRDSSSMKDGDFSVILQNVTMRDEGTYECRIINRDSKGSNERCHHSISLTVSGTDEETPEEREDEEEVTNGSYGFLIFPIFVAVSLFVIIIIIGVCFHFRRSKALEKYRLSNQGNPATEKAKGLI